MKLLAVMDRGWPCDHAFIEEVLARRVPLHGHSVHFVMPSRPADGGQHLWHGATVSAIPRTMAVPGFLRRGRVILKLLRESPWDWVVVRNESVMAYVISGMCRVPVAFQLSHQMEETVLEDWRDHPSFVRFCRAVAAVARRSVRRAVMKRADLVFPVSDAMQAMLAETGERVEAMVPMPLGVAPTAMVTTQRRDQLRLELMIAPEQPMLIYVGTLNRLRHLDVLVRSLLHVRDSGIDAKLVFVGDGPRAADRECLEHSAQELGLAEHVRFLGRRPRQEVYDYIGSADLGLSYFPAIPLFRQNSPIKVMEYLGMGLPVVCTPQPEQQFVVEHCDGGIVAGSDSAQAFSEAIISALRRNWNAQEIRSKIQAIRGYDLLAAQFVQALEARLATQSAAR